ncbi:MAG: hypothetical protein ABR598_06035 [Candidatus Dormibacteria bacterium]
MRQLHIIRRADDELARDVVAHQVRSGDEVRVVFVGDASVTSVPEGAEVVAMPPLQYDGLVELLAWCERVVSW